MDEGTVSSMQVAKKMVAIQAGTARPIRMRGAVVSSQPLQDTPQPYRKFALTTKDKDAHHVHIPPLPLPLNLSYPHKHITYFVNSDDNPQLFDSIYSSYNTDTVPLLGKYCSRYLVLSCSHSLPKYRQTD